MEGALQALEETAYWFELLVESGIVEKTMLASLTQESEELTAIFVAIVTKIENRIQQTTSQKKKVKDVD